MTSAEAVVSAIDDFSRMDRHTTFSLIERVRFDFPTHHPQGVAFVGERIFLSSVEVLERPVPSPDPVASAPGRGIGHLFVSDRTGDLLADVILGEGDMYHPGGIDFDGEHLWVPVGEYRPHSNSIMVTVDPETLAVVERFRVPDSIGWAIRDPTTGVVHGGNWGSRRFYSWTVDGVELDRWANPSSFVDYQDCQSAGNGLAICSGIAVLSDGACAREYELGGIATVDLVNHRIVHEMPIQVRSAAGHVVTRNPFTTTVDGSGLMIHLAPDDGLEGNGTELLTFRQSG